MRETTWAGGAKLTWADVKRIRARKKYTRDKALDDAERLEVSQETVWRAYTGRSWHTVRFRTLPPEHKRCVICRARFERRFANGRHRSDTFWAQKVTCSNSCHARRNWMLGRYDNR